MVSRKHGQPTVALVILTRNEIGGLSALFERVPVGAVDEVLAIDYRSADGTPEFLRQRGVRIIPQEVPGRGEAFRLAARRTAGEILVFFSPDGNENPTDIPQLIAAVRGGADMAIASRFLPGGRNEEHGKALPLRAWANRAFTWLANAWFGGHLTDAINGFRAVRRASFDRLRTDAPSFSIEYQMSIRALKLGMRIAEIPTVEGRRLGGGSKAATVPTGLGVLKTLLREIWLGHYF